ncbi:DUF1799 domain-containing protein [Thorsellia kenyensis]|uniref:DUF1799 domain-containing protein n=1 Tax=Thorsellia kenyensis TaxID=1549888 RepID=A0ABV6CA97_9GAMM
MASFGFSADDFSIDVYPENELSVTIFQRLGTQWRYSFGGATGLDYNALPAIFDLLGIKKKKRPQIFSDLQIMESAALAEIHKSNK